MIKILNKIISGIYKSPEKKGTDYWVIIANVVKERPYGPGGIEKKEGTKLFRGGSKIHIIDWYPGTCDSVEVIGHHRKSKRR